MRGTAVAEMTRIGQINDGHVYSGRKWLARPRYVAILENAAIRHGWEYTPAFPAREDSTGSYIRMLFARRGPGGVLVQFHVVWRMGLAGWDPAIAHTKIGTGEWERVGTLAEVKATIETAPASS